MLQSLYAGGSSRKEGFAQSLRITACNSSKSHYFAPVDFCDRVFFVLLSYASLLEKQTIVLREAERLYADAPTDDHAVLLKELRDPVAHLERLVLVIAKKVVEGE